MRKWWYFVFVFVGLFLVLFFVRLVSPSQIDDVSPGIFCEEKLLDWADVYYVVPKFENVSINKEWCDEILSRKMAARGTPSELRPSNEVLSLSGELAMHGVYHKFKEFGVARDLEYLDEGIKIFEECFGFVPEKFKPPQLALANENDWIKDKMEVDLIWNQIFHKVYHCGDTGLFPNWVVRIF